MFICLDGTRFAFTVSTSQDMGIPKIISNQKRVVLMKPIKRIRCLNKNAKEVPPACAQELFEKHLFELNI